MTFGKALEREIARQGIAVAEVAQKSGVSKGTIYNILNGTTEESRIRAATRRALARGCDRELRILPDGSVLFVAPESAADVEVSDEISFRFLPFRSFMSQNHLANAFDWLYAQEENGVLTGLQIVDRVFQRREDFLGLEILNNSDAAIDGLRFDLEIVYDVGISGNVACRIGGVVNAQARVEYTVFLLAGPAFELTLSHATYTNISEQVVGIASHPTYRYEGDSK